MKKVLLTFTALLMAVSFATIGCSNNVTITEKTGYEYSEEIDVPKEGSHSWSDNAITLNLDEVIKLSEEAKFEKIVITGDFDAAKDAGGNTYSNIRFVNQDWTENWLTEDTFKAFITDIEKYENVIEEGTLKPTSKISLEITITSDQFASWKSSKVTGDDGNEYQSYPLNIGGNFKVSNLKITATK